MTRYTVRLEDDTVGIFTSKKNSPELVGVIKPVVLHDCNGASFYTTGKIVEVLESEVIA